MLCVRVCVCTRTVSPHIANCAFSDKTTPVFSAHVTPAYLSSFGVHTVHFTLNAINMSEWITEKWHAKLQPIFDLMQHGLLQQIVGWLNSTFRTNPCVFTDGPTGALLLILLIQNFLIFIVTLHFALFNLAIKRCIIARWAVCGRFLHWSIYLLAPVSELLWT